MLNSLVIGHNVRIIVPRVNSYPSQYISIYSHQTTSLTTGNDCSIEACIKVPRVAVNIGNRTVLTGKLQANSITVGYDVHIEDNVILDNDGDGMSNHWETANGLDPTINDAAADADGDGLPNGEEFICGTRPNVTDTDNDGINDGDEYSYWLNREGSISRMDDIEPFDPVTGTSGDGLPNIIDPDSDNDGLLDGEELTGWSVIVQGTHYRSWPC